MPPRSPTFLDRLSLSRNGRPLHPLHHKKDDRTTDYDLDELDPQPRDHLLSPHSPEPNKMATSSREPYRDDLSPSMNGTEHAKRPRKSKVLFAGLPPPITELVRQNRPRQEPSPPEVVHSGDVAQNVTSSLLNIGSVFFDSRPKSQPVYKLSPDSVWRNLRIREKAIGDELQQMLDMQSIGLSGGLVDGARAIGGDRNGLDTFSDTGSSTPTGTSYYSTATSRSKMVKSLSPPEQSTAGGDVIPVRQPRRSKPVGIRAARRGLLKSMVALGDLKAEEDARVNSAISQRKNALARLRKLSGRQQKISSELHALEEDGEEPLGSELRNLESQRGSLTTEIKELEERLVGLRNKRRWVDGRIRDVRSQREAGLSGYRGALKEVEAEADSLVRRPPVKPLDREFWLGQDEDLDSNGPDPTPGGDEFLSLIPERRTLEMAKSWWEAEIKALEERRREVDKNRDALERGEDMWRETIDLVTDYETGLVKLMKGGSPRKGKERGSGPGGDDTVKQLISKMSTVITTLEGKLQVAEDNQWNLLLCAIGAELEAFKEAERVLREGLDLEIEPDPIPTPVEKEGSTASMESPVFKASVSPIGLRMDESDNEVPHDLLMSPPEEDNPTPREPSPEIPPTTTELPPLERSDSENSIPPEFLAEHA